MPELKYLADKKRIQREVSFATDIIYPMDNGSADIQLYDEFSGIQLMVSLF